MKDNARDAPEGFPRNVLVGPSFRPGASSAVCTLPRRGGALPAQSGYGIFRLLHRLRTFLSFGRSSEYGRAKAVNPRDKEICRLNSLLAFLKELGTNFRDLLPVVGIVAAFQILVIQEPMAELGLRLVGAVLALLGLTFFVRGLTMSVFPLGDAVAEWLARRGSLTLLVGCGFAIGFGSTVAEPALGAVAGQAAMAAAEAGRIAQDPEAVAGFSLLLRYAASGAVGVAVAFGVLRVVRGWPIIWFVLPGYALAAVLAVSYPSVISAVAFDAGAAATSAINIPLMMALGVGLAGMIRTRSALVDGFGLVALASLTPMIVILIFSAVTAV